MEDRAVLVVLPVPDRLAPDSVLLALGKDPVALAPVDPVAQQAALAHVRAVPEADLVVLAHVQAALVADPEVPAHVREVPVVPVDILVLQGLVLVRLVPEMRPEPALVLVQVRPAQVQHPDSVLMVRPDRVVVIVPVVVVLAVVPVVVVSLAVITTGIKIISLKVTMMIAQKTQSSLKALFLRFSLVPCSA